MVRPPRFEVIPLDGIEDGVVDYLPAEVTVTVTSSPRHGLAAGVSEVYVSYIVSQMAFADRTSGK